LLTIPQISYLVKHSSKISKERSKERSEEKVKKKVSEIYFRIAANFFKKSLIKK